MNKKELRAEYKAKRQQLSQADVERLSLAIANRLLSLPIWEHTFFHIFLPIQNQKEVDTECILHLLSGRDKEVVVAKSDMETREMTHYLLTEDTRLVVNQYGIPEPVEGSRVPPIKLDVVFVPLLAFDASGNRVGYGKGFYDKFLTQCKPRTLKIGLSFFEAVPEIWDVFESDVKLDYCVTPDTIYAF